jgi:hypothetical protein
MPNLGRLTEDLYFCPGCHDGDHEAHRDLFDLAPFGTLACHCQRCSPYPT